MKKKQRDMSRDSTHKPLNEYAFQHQHKDSNLGDKRLQRQQEQKRKNMAVVHLEANAVRRDDLQGVSL